MTELEIVYSIIETLNAYQYTNDNPINERVVRNHLASYRGEILRKYFSEGENITDECFQLFKVKLKKERDFLFSIPTPQIMRFHNRNGFSLFKLGISIPVVNSTTFNFSNENDFPLGCLLGNNLKLKIRQKLDNCVSIDSNNSILHYELLKEVKKNEIVLDMFAVLVNPESSDSYDWKSDPFPFPGEKIDELKTTILRKEFGVTSQVKSDEIQNARVDNVRYHENTNLEQ